MQEEIMSAINQALEMLVRADRELLVNDVNERSITHRLALYLENFFPGWNVDCEYNRDFNEPKRLDLHPRQISSDDLHARTVYPDIIVHRRGTNMNLLVIEVKKTTSQENDDFDLHKLAEFKNQLGYLFAVFIKFETASESSGVSSISLV